MTRPPKVRETGILRDCIEFDVYQFFGSGKILILTLGGLATLEMGT